MEPHDIKQSSFSASYSITHDLKVVLFIEAHWHCHRVCIPFGSGDLQLCLRDFENINLNRFIGTISPFSVIELKKTEYLDKTYTYKFVVRGYELDSYGHVNNAVYLNYLEQARWDIFEQLGLLKYFKETGNFLVVIENRIKYIHELNIFDKVYIETSMKRLGFFVEFKQNIFFQDSNKKIAKSVSKCLFVDKYRNPLDIPDHIIEDLADEQN